MFQIWMIHVLKTLHKETRVLQKFIHKEKKNTNLLNN